MNTRDAVALVGSGSVTPARSHVHVGSSSECRPAIRVWGNGENTASESGPGSAMIKDHDVKHLWRDSCK